MRAACVCSILMNAGATLLALYWTVQGLIRSSMARGKGVAPDQGDGPPEVGGRW